MDLEVYHPEVGEWEFGTPLEESDIELADCYLHHTSEITRMGKEKDAAKKSLVEKIGQFKFGVLPDGRIVTVVRKECAAEKEPRKAHVSVSLVIA